MSGIQCSNLWHVFRNPSMTLTQHHTSSSNRSCYLCCMLRGKIRGLLQMQLTKSETLRWVQRLGRSGHSQGHITGHIKLTKSTSMSFSLSVYTVCLLMLCSDSSNTSWKESHSTCSSRELSRKKSSGCSACCKINGRSKHKPVLTLTFHFICALNVVIMTMLLK